MSQPLSRRRALLGLAALGALPIAACKRGGVDTAPAHTDPPDPTCGTPTEEQVEGPFYPGEPDVRLDLREDRDGVQLDVDLLVVETGTCAPMANAEVDIWSADARGDYSGYADFDTVGETWLRGQQITDADGRARFRLIVPGSYPGRAVHLHVKVRAEGKPELTTQLYLPDAVVRRVLRRSEYRAGAGMTDLAGDDFYVGDTLLEVIDDTDDHVAAQGRLVV